MPLNTEENLQFIWGQDYWNDEAKRIELEYWNLIKDRLPNVPPSNESVESEHRIEAFVLTLAKGTGLGNLHVQDKSIFTAEVELTFL